MRIAILSLHWPRTLSSGVGKKYNRQINTWRQMGHEVVFSRICSCRGQLPHDIRAIFPI
jgi:hypothetical protein